MSLKQTFFLQRRRDAPDMVTEYSAFFVTDALGISLVYRLFIKFTNLCKLLLITVLPLVLVLSPSVGC